VADIEACLPQTQCTQCGFPSCHDYAVAIGDGRAQINQCPPGAEPTIHALARLLRRNIVPLDPAFGAIEEKQLVRIHEAECIGCTLCITACPVNAIIGAAKKMHSVIADQCTGCKLCLPVCPTDCIVLYPATLATDEPLAAREDATLWHDFSENQVREAKQHYQDKQARLEIKASDKQKKAKKRLRRTLEQDIAAAVARTRKKRQ
jgi:electron transport complex protein RnfB